jgi:methionyl-tRNA synthetase
VDIQTLVREFPKPTRAVITAGMPYANGPIHLGHLAGAHVPPDVYARWMRMLIGDENVLFVCGSDDHGSGTEVAALKEGKSVPEFIAQTHAKQKDTFARYGISFNTYSGTSRPECFPIHSKISQEFMRKMHKNGMLEKRITNQWYDPKLNRFLQDRYVRGKCPNPRCENQEAYSDNCEECGIDFEPCDLINPRSALSDATPIMKETAHWWLNMWQVAEEMREWVQSKEGKWRMPVYNEVINTVLPTISFSNTFEDTYKSVKAELPKHKSKYAPGKKIAVQFYSRTDMQAGQEHLEKLGVECSLVDGWAHRSITRDVKWGIPVPSGIDPDLEGKTLFVWPDSLIAPIAFTQVALKESGRDPESYVKFWKDPTARIYQFLGQDNVYFYTLMQAAMWLGSQDDPHHLPREGELQLTDILACYHLMVNGQKMSKSTGNWILADEMINDKGYEPDQVRYFLALLSLPEKRSNFDFAILNERNKFLAGPMNAAFERPISAAHSKFDGKVPSGELLPDVIEETNKIVQRYLRSMDRAEYSTLLFAVENYARNINSLFNKYKPHDDRMPEESRRNALYSAFYMLKNLCIMLQPFAPHTMEKLRESLNLPTSIFRVEELGTPIPGGHSIGQKQQFFPAVPV